MGMMDTIHFQENENNIYKTSKTYNIYNIIWIRSQTI
jgi:hypothetical protein